MAAFVDFGKKDEYSLRRALGNTPGIIPLLKERGQTHYAVSNYGEVSNWIQQLFCCREANIVPILGMEASVNNYRRRADGTGKILVRDLCSGEERPAGELDETTRDLVTVDYPVDLFARTEEGYYNIIRIHNDAQINGMEQRPRTSDSFLERHGAGVIAVLPTPQSEVASLIFNGMFDEALEKYRYYETFFDRVFLALTLVDDPEYGSINEGIVRFALANHIPMIPVCTSHYHFPDDDEAFHTVGKLAERRYGVSSGIDLFPGMHYRSREEVDSLFREKHCSSVFTEMVYRQAMETLDSLTGEFQVLEIDTSLRLPKFSDGPARLRERAQQGFRERGYDRKGRDYIDRFEYELQTITGAGFADYFLLLGEVFDWYRNELNSVCATGRGSAGGSLILNCLGCTGLDPVRHNLLFERFLDAERFREIMGKGGALSGADCPDVDSDFATSKKELVKEHFAKKYGSCCTASIGTAGLMKTKSVLKELARLYGVPQEEINRVTAGEMKGYLDDDDDPVPLAGLKEMFPGLRTLLAKYPQMESVFDKLRGSIANWGKHAGGVLVTDFDLTLEIPVRRDPEGKLVTCWQEGGAARELGMMGFVKFDILAIDQLNIFEHTFRLIRERTGKVITLEDIPLDDPKALRQMNDHDGICIFQFDTPLAARVAEHMNGIHSFEDLGSLSTLMRPAALANRFDVEFGMRRADNGSVYIPECLKSYLGSTYGLPIYQEHIMQIAMHMAGMDRSSSFRLMKALYKGKLRGREEIDEWRKRFLDGCRPKVAAGEVKSGYPEEMFEQLLAFQGYGFPKAHATAYAMYSAAGLWLKAYYPLEFLCANLSVTERAAEKRGVSLLKQRVGYCRSRGFRIDPPDVRFAGAEWIIRDGGLMAPLGNLKGLGENDVAAVIRNRPFSSASEFMDKVGFGKAKFEILLFGGALDCFGDREFLYSWYHEFYAKRGKARPPELLFEDMEQTGCFEIRTAFSPAELERAFEELNGFTIPENLLLKYASFLKEHPEVRTIGKAGKGRGVRNSLVFCRVAGISGFRSKRGRSFVRLELSDGVNDTAVVTQENNYVRYREALAPGNVIVLPVQYADEGIYVGDLDRREIKVIFRGNEH